MFQENTQRKNPFLRDSDCFHLEAPPGVEPGYEALQAPT